MNEHYFVSYSRIDGANFAERLAGQLAVGPSPYPVWLDVRDTQPGADWDNQIRDAIQTCQGLLFLMTKDSVQDYSACKFEWVWALNCKKPVIPLRVDAGAGLPFRLSSRQYIDFSGGFDTGLARLRQYLASAGSPGFVLQELRNQLVEAQRELQRADPAQRSQIGRDVRDLTKKIADQERLVASAGAAARPAQVRYAEPPVSRPDAGLIQPEAGLIQPEAAHVQTARGGRGRVFISYRRDDAAYPAGYLFDRIGARFGEDRVMMDIDSIEPGADFGTAITEAIESCRLLLAVIGEQWLTVTGNSGRRRLDDPHDFVRLELEAALAGQVRIVPVLVNGAPMPRIGQLPASLAGLAHMQALSFSGPADADALLRVLESVLGETQTENRRTRKWFKL